MTVLKLQIPTIQHKDNAEEFKREFRWTGVLTLLISRTSILKIAISMFMIQMGYLCSLSKRLNKVNYQYYKSIRI